MREDKLLIYERIDGAVNAVLEQLRDDIEEGLTDYIIGEPDTPTAKKMFKVMDKALEIIDKYREG